MKISLPYFAGFFDADGTVGIHKYVYKKDYPRGPQKGNIRYQIKVQVGNVDPTVILAYKATFGGYTGSSRARSQTHRLLHHWGAASQIACAFLEKIYPYSIVKKTQIEYAFELNKHLRSTWRILRDLPPIHPERTAIYAERQRLADAITSAKWVDYPIVSPDAQAAKAHVAFSA